MYHLTVEQIKYVYRSKLKQRVEHEELVSPMLSCMGVQPQHVSITGRNGGVRLGSRTSQLPVDH
jgi:hypothetical protein